MLYCCCATRSVCSCLLLRRILLVGVLMCYVVAPYLDLAATTLQPDRVHRKDTKQDLQQSGLRYAGKNENRNTGQGPPIMWHEPQFPGLLHGLRIKAQTRNTRTLILTSCVPCQHLTTERILDFFGGKTEYFTLEPIFQNCQNGSGFRGGGGGRLGGGGGGGGGEKGVWWLLFGYIVYAV